MKQLVDQIERGKAIIKAETYTVCSNAMKDVVKAFNVLISAINHDMKVCMKLNNDILAQTQTEDEFDRNGVLDIRLEYNKKLQELNAAKTKEERTRLKGEVDALRLSMLQTKLAHAKTEAARSSIQKQINALTGGSP